MRDSFYRKRQRRRRRITFAIFLVLIIATVAILIVTCSGGSDSPGEDPARESGAETGPGTGDNPFENGGQAHEPHFSDFYFYEADKAERYAAFHALHEEMPLDEVVWKVNNHLDYEFYGFDQEAALNDPFIIVNKYYRVPPGYEPAELMRGVDGYYLNAPVDEAFRKMREDIAAEIGGTISIASAYRSVEYQETLFNRYLANDAPENVLRYSAKAGHSEHHTGLVLDLTGSFGSLRDFINTPEGRWVQENAHKYGFIIRYKDGYEHITGYESEPWHLRYIGIGAATDMVEKGIQTFEEYRVKYISHSPPE